MLLASNRLDLRHLLLLVCLMPGPFAANEGLFSGHRMAYLIEFGLDFELSLLVKLLLQCHHR